MRIERAARIPLTSLEQSLLYLLKEETMAAISSWIGSSRGGIRIRASTTGIGACKEGGR